MAAEPRSGGALLTAPLLGTTIRPEPLGSTSDDARLLEAMAHGLGALEILYDRYRTIAFSIALRITNDSALAEDVVQEAFLAVWRNAAGYRQSRGSVKTWLMAIVHHRAIDAVRRRKPVSELPEEEFESSADLQGPDVCTEVMADLDAVEIHRAIAALSQVQGEAIRLAYFGGLTQQEIAERTGTPLGTVKSRIRLGLLAMRASMVDENERDRTMAPRSECTLT